MELSTGRWVTYKHGFSVSESTVYRLLRREGLVKRSTMQLKAGKEYHRKTTGLTNYGLLTGYPVSDMEVSKKVAQSLRILVILDSLPLASAKRQADTRRLKYWSG